MKKKLALVDIRIDGRTQHRPVEDDTVNRYAALIHEGVEFPLIKVVFDGKDNYLVDGFHRYHAHRKLEKTEIMAQVDEGTKREAVWVSLSANKDHGLPRQTGTLKDMLFKTVFPDEAWSKEEDSALADWVGATTSYVARCRKEYVLFQNQPPEEPKKAAEPKPEVQPGEITDKRGKVVPAHLVEIFERNGEIRMKVQSLTGILKDCRDGYNHFDPLYANCKVDQLKAAITNARSVLRFSMAYAVCAYCGGDVNNEDCGSCDGKGFLNEQQWISVPEDLKG